MPGLREHQFRVAGVAKIILNHLLSKLSLNEEKEIITACLLHDIGNIIKFDLSISKNLLNADLDISYWQTIKNEFINKYGNDEHAASVEICKELGVSGRVIQLVDSVGFLQATDNLNSGDLGRQICAYADVRVMPKAVAALEERFADLRKRYAYPINKPGEPDKRDIFEKNLREIEKQIFTQSKMTPGDITEESIQSTMLELKSYNI